MTSIEWTDVTWNPLVGCSRVSAGCVRCYAERLVHRGLAEQHRGLTRATSRGPVWTGDVRLVESRLDEPLRRRKPKRVFVNSLSDLFHESVSDETIAAVFGVMAAAPQHTFQVLTKRAERMRDWFAWLGARGGIGPYIRSDEGRAALRGIVRNKHTERFETYRGEVIRSAQDAWAMVMNAAACVGGGPLPNVHLGVSCEDQKAADERVPLLVQTPAAVRFVSAEPLLGPIDFYGAGSRGGDDGDPIAFSALRGFDGCDPPIPGLDWIIVGGESGPGARPCLDGWIRSIVDQCRASAVPVFVKQLGAHVLTYGALECFNDGGWPMGTRLHVGETMQSPFWAQLRDRKGGDPAEWPEDLRVRQMPNALGR